MPHDTELDTASAQVTQIVLCASSELEEGGLAVPFDVVFGGQTCRAFAIRFEGKVYAYLNRCSHIAMEMDMQPNRFFDAQGSWLVCASHGATYHPATGQCAGGPCNGGLVKVEVSEAGGVVFWHPSWNIQPVQF